MLTAGGSGLYAAGEDHLLWVPRRYSGERRGVVWCHGRGDTARGTAGITTAGLHLLVEAGLPVISADLGGPTSWGNPTSQARFWNAADYLVTRTRCPAEVLIYAGSMGTLVGLNAARGNLARIAAIAAALPAVDLADLHDNRGFGAEIETAYGGAAGYAAARAANNPSENTAAYQDVPIALWYGTADTVTVPARVEAFAAATGAQATPFAGAHNFQAPYDARGPRDFLLEHA